VTPVAPPLSRPSGPCSLLTAAQMCKRRCGGPSVPHLRRPRTVAPGALCLGPRHSLLQEQQGPPPPPPLSLSTRVPRLAFCLFHSRLVLGSAFLGQTEDRRLWSCDATPQFVVVCVRRPLEAATAAHCCPLSTPLADARRHVPARAAQMPTFKAADGPIGKRYDVSKATSVLVRACMPCL